MMRNARRVARQLLPPIVADPLRRSLRGRGEREEWEYRPDGWPQDPGLEGWDVASVVEAQLARLPELARSLSRADPIGLSSESDPGGQLNYAVHNTIMSFGYVLALSAHATDRLSFLDWGGGLGQYALYARALLPDVHIDYHCRDLPRLTRAGRQVLPDATFHDSDETVVGRTFDLVMASSSLQYVQDWRQGLGGLAALTGRYLYVTRQPFVSSAPSFVVVQRPHRHGYRTAYPGWFLNRSEFLNKANGLGLKLHREFLIDEQPIVANAPEQATYRGFLFSPVREPAGAK